MHKKTLTKKDYNKRSLQVDQAVFYEFDKLNSKIPNAC